jgi:nitroreductase
MLPGAPRSTRLGACVNPPPATMMDLDTAIRTRRTHKAFAPTPVDDETLRELFDLARWAPNHHLTNPWRFHVLGPKTRAELAAAAEAASPGSAKKLDRAPTLVVLGVRLEGDHAQRQEDLIAAAIAGYIVLLGAHARGLAGYWRTLPLLDEPAVRAALSIPPDEQPLGLLHLGHARQPQPSPERAPVVQIATFLE